MRGATIDAVETKRIDDILAERLGDLGRFEFREDAIRELIAMTAPQSPPQRFGDDTREGTGK